MLAALPAALAPFFWEYRLEAVDLDRHAVTVIERLLEYGDDAAIRWLRAAYPADRIRAVVAMSRRLSPKTRAFWQTVLAEQPAGAAAPPSPAGRCAC